MINDNAYEKFVLTTRWYCNDDNDKNLQESYIGKPAEPSFPVTLIQRTPIPKNASDFNNKDTHHKFLLPVTHFLQADEFGLEEMRNE